MSDVIDFSNTGIELINGGEYDAVISVAKLAKSKAGNDMLSFEFSIQDEPYYGRRAFRNFSLLPSSLWATKRALLNMGVEPELLIDRITKDSLQSVCSDLVGEEVRLRISIVTRSDNGEPGNEVEVLKSF